MLQANLEAAKQKAPILLMTHLVLGYPSFEENRAAIAAMDQAGVELVELQIPFSEPSADGPVIALANAQSLKGGTKVDQCLAFAKEVAHAFPRINFLFMTYLNLCYARGLAEMADQAKAAGIKGFILPDLPFEEAEQWIKLCKKRDLANVLIMTPTSSLERLSLIGRESTGLVYSVGRRGVTGLNTDFGPEIGAQIARYREATKLPLALGFGVKSKEDVSFLTGKVDIAVIGSKLIELGSAQKIESFLKTVR